MPKPENNLAPSTTKPVSLIPEENLNELEFLCGLAPPGCVVEVGVYRGGSAYRLAKSGREIHLFDTFSGMPEKSEGDVLDLGEFSDVKVEDVRNAIPHAKLHVGYFPKTLTADVKNIGFVHIDCDHYATCRAAIENLWPRMVPGGVMAWDDFPLRSIRKAIGEFFRLEDLNFTNHGICFVIKA